jgi:hypothetical protein
MSNLKEQIDLSEQYTSNNLDDLYEIMKKTEIEERHQCNNKRRDFFKCVLGASVAFGLGGPLMINTSEVEGSNNNIVTGGICVLCITHCKDCNSCNFCKDCIISWWF